MPRAWTKQEKREYKKELEKLYVEENLSIREVGERLGISYRTVFDRLKRFNIPTQPHKKEGYLNKRKNILLPPPRTEKLAELFGILLGDGGLSPTQVLVHLGSKEEEYAIYTKDLLSDIFQTKARMLIRKTGYRDVYIGSVDVVRWLLAEGLVFNKTKSQVDVPEWIFSKDKYKKGFVRGFFDTDGSVYKIKYGRQILFKNASLPLLRSLREILLGLEYTPSRVSGRSVYLTRAEDLDRFFRTVKPANNKHVKRYQAFSGKM